MSGMAGANRFREHDDRLTSGWEVVYPLDHGRSSFLATRRCTGVSMMIVQTIPMPSISDIKYEKPKIRLQYICDIFFNINLICRIQNPDMQRADAPVRRRAGEPVGQRVGGPAGRRAGAPAHRVSAEDG